MIGGALWSARLLNDGYEASPWPTYGNDPLFFVMPLLFLTGLAGLYARCREFLGSEAKVAFAVSFVGIAATLVGQVGLLLAAGAWFVIRLGFVVGSIGLMALGTATVQSRTLPRWNALPLVIGSVGILTFPSGAPPNGGLEIFLSSTLWAMFGFGWALLGYDLFFFSGRRNAHRPTPLRHRKQFPSEKV